MKSFIFATLLVSATFTEASDIIISAKIKEPMRSTIERDLSVLEKLNFKETSFKAMEIFGIIKLNSTNALEWLSERVKYIVEVPLFIWPESLQKLCTV